MAGVLVADEINLVKTFTSLSVAKICQFLTDKVVIGLLLSILWGTTLLEWVVVTQNHFPKRIGDEQEWNQLQRQNSVPLRLTEIQNTAPQGLPALTSALEPILGVIMPSVGETFKSVINELTY